jgi:hypothetical protein
MLPSEALAAAPLLSALVLQACGLLAP